MPLPRMRTISQAYKELKLLDPNTSISQYRIKCLAKSGRVKTVSAGNRLLISLDSLLKYLENPEQEENEPTSYGILRAVSE